jgi:ribosomal protein S27E
MGEELNEYEYNENYPFRSTLKVKCPNCGNIGCIVNQNWAENYRCIKCLKLFKRVELLKKAFSEYYEY